jgi:hypothetical protein
MKKKKKKTLTKKKSGARRAARRAAPRSRGKAKARGRGKVSGSKRKLSGNKKQRPARSRRAAAKRGRIVASDALRRQLVKRDELRRQGTGPETGGQSGDTEGLSNAEIADSESVKELVEEGQSFEAGVVSGVENAKDADKGGVRTRQVPEDDVPQEYLDED